jgi:hypothetical protein
MVNVGEWNWVVNTDDMTCKNVENDVTIKMEIVGGNLKAMLHDMPIRLFTEISEYNNGEKIIEEIVRIAREKYLSSKQ